MGKLENEEFICIDCEATGLDAKKERIVEVAVVSFTYDKLFETYESLVDPECGVMPEDAYNVHRISYEMVKGQPKIRDVIPKLLEIIGSKTIIGHQVQFDIDIISNEAERCGIPCRIQKNKFIDTLRLARLYGDSPSNALEKLGIHFNVPNEGAHRAMNDVMVNIEVFKHLSRRYLTLEKLFEVLSRPILMKAMPLGKYKGRPFRDIPLQYLLYAAKKDYDQDLLYSLRNEIKQRKKGGLFQQASNPFQKLFS